MNPQKKKFLLIAAALLVVGVLAIFLQPGPPDGECVAQGAPSSGFKDSDSNCPISQASYDKIADYDSSPKPFRIAGLLVVVVGIGVGVFGLTRRTRPREQPTP